MPKKRTDKYLYAFIAWVILGVWLIPILAPIMLQLPELYDFAIAMTVILVWLVIGARFLEKDWKAS